MTEKDRKTLVEKLDESITAWQKNTFTKATIELEIEILANAPEAFVRLVELGSVALQLTGDKSARWFEDKEGNSIIKNKDNVKLGTFTMKVKNNG